MIREIYSSLDNTTLSFRITTLLQGGFVKCNSYVPSVYSQVRHEAASSERLIFATYSVPSS